jgi:8-oxo-dGTP diphosphatase
MDITLIKTFGGIIRVRCLAVVVNKGRLLLLNHKGLNDKNSYWMPPGGGLEVAENITDCLKRELKEETSLDLLTSSFMTYYEFTNQYLHAIELFFRVEATGYLASLGTDPELEAEDQLITDLQWMNSKEVLALGDDVVHPLVKEMAKSII